MADHIVAKIKEASKFAEFVFEHVGKSSAENAGFIQETARSCKELSDAMILLRAEQIKIEKYLEKMLKEEEKKEFDVVKEINELKRQVNLLLRLENARRKKQ